MSSPVSFNRLKDEESAYLKQHKDNPVHWWSYGPEALQKSRDENKPIFLSVGYSSCHWCHVMAHESFEDPQVAEFLNENFINIKVDKEELPDLDNYYQQACHLYTQSGGWPLSAFLLPDMRPYFVGTYFPAVAQEGRTSFMELIQELHRAYSESPEKVKENAEKVTEALKDGLIPKEKVEYPGHFPPPASILEAVKQFQDNDWGGYGEAPKFPQFAFYEWAVEQMLDGMVEQEHGEHIVKSIELMLMGGMADHARGGIHRYSTDEKWLVPHFEKMLYDQAGLLRLLAKTSLIYPSPLIYDTLLNTLDYIKSEMMADENYFFSSQDADSEGVEGLYFTFSEVEFEDILNRAGLEEEFGEKYDLQKIKKWFQITPEGNFERQLNIISLNYECRQEIFTQDGWDMIRDIRKALWEERKGRIPPATDTKGVASWNFMLTAALIDVMQYCQIDIIRRQASEIFNDAMEGQYKTFLNSRDESGMSIRHTTTKKISLPYFEDYVFFAEAQLRVYEVTGNPVFRDNFQDTLEFITREFVDEEKVLTRAKSANELELYPNQAQSPFDSSFRTPLGTFIGLTRRAAILNQDQELLNPVEKALEELTHDCLKNPLSAGEALRALTYPKDAYRVVKVPVKWLDQGKFVNFIPYFLPRFVLDYTRDETDTWQICSFDKCELQGEGLDNFLETLVPTKPEETETVSE